MTDAQPTGTKIASLHAQQPRSVLVSVLAGSVSGLCRFVLMDPESRIFVSGRSFCCFVVGYMDFQLFCQENKPENVKTASLNVLPNLTLSYCCCLSFLGIISL